MPLDYYEESTTAKHTTNKVLLSVRTTFVYLKQIFLMELYKSNISFTKFKIIPLNWKCNKDYFDMLYVKIEAMGTEISSVLG